MESPKQRNPLKVIINTTIAVFFILLIFFLLLKIATVYDPDVNRKSNLEVAVAKIELISTVAWDFIKPFLQLIAILLIVEWLLGKLGISFMSTTSRIEWNVQTIIAIVIVTSFALAALSGIPGVGVLKDLALVVVGFYFGSQKRGQQSIGIERQDNP